jgi:hypothetical protein
MNYWMSLGDDDVDKAPMYLFRVRDHVYGELLYEQYGHMVRESKADFSTEIDVLEGLFMRYVRFRIDVNCRYQEFKRTLDVRTMKKILKYCADRIRSTGIDILPSRSTLQYTQESDLYIRYMAEAGKDEEDDDVDALDLPHAKEKATYYSINVINTNRIHDSGYNILIVTGMTEDGDEYILSDKADMVHWEIPPAKLIMMRSDFDGRVTKHFGAKYVAEPGQYSDVAIEVYPNDDDW